jgi:hypothetical protein
LSLPLWLTQTAPSRNHEVAPDALPLNGGSAKGRRT